MKLSVNVDHVATLRNARGEGYPDPIFAAVSILTAGADGITIHLRGDRRHIRERDVELLRKIVNKKLTLEMAPTDEMVDFACRILPDMVTIVPEKREEITTESGYDVISNKESLLTRIKKLRDKRILVSIFIDPVTEQINMAKEVGAEFIEIHTGKYANAFRKKDHIKISYEFKLIHQAVKYAKSLGLNVNIGHGLTLDNLKPFIDIEGIDEASIGFSIISDAILFGIDKSVHRFIELFHKK